MTLLDEVQAAVAAVAERVGPAVVGVGQGWGLGSGIVVGDGLVLTNAHNLRGGEVAVSFGDDRTERGHVAGVDVDGDLAVVSVDTTGVTPLEWADGDLPGVGGVVFAAANPGGRGLRVTVGLVSAVGRAFRGPRGRRVTGSLEHTAPLVRGSSGGPIVDREGRLLGINTNRLGEGFYAAIPADAQLRARFEALARGESASRRHLGVGLVPGRAARHLRRSVGLPDRDGVLVREVQEDSPAARAGIRRGDLIVEAAGRAVTGIDDLYTALDGLDDGQSLALGIVRGAEELSLSVTFGDTREEGSV
ncbi:MAG TPA: S1C family serine protease [Acidimicrobiales bacterium]|nr:S1C family serine protease [Acidimicrobiales bacterium]